MKIVVIGGSGLIGSVLVEKLQPQVLDDPEVVDSSTRKEEG